MDLTKYIASIPDYPSKGIIFRDITPLMEDREAYKEAVDQLVKWAGDLDSDIDVVASPEARGFLFGCPVSYAINSGFVPVRKPGKLPRDVISEEYELEYGTNEVQIHSDSIKKGQKVIIVDDLLATGGTVEAAVKLIEELGGEVVGLGFVIELVDLKGRDKFKDIPVFSMIEY
ncbi:MAG: adenine phosphoribosyltransferase [Thomasclavelia sp.]|jgi:adenine phosphoribosyltransferase|nr:adenine phosphoribosyltransferase [Thomasclavelia sp.]